jgi:octaprenyl-diphosphate synthase
LKRELKEIFKTFEADFRQFDAHFSHIMSSDIKLIDEVAKYLVKHKGKQFRPALVIISARTIAPATEATYTTAAVVELLHTASLVHDDVLDDAELRRGFATIHKKWKNKIAILMGDYLLSKSLIAATETGQLEVMNTVATVAKRLIKGAIFEVQKSRSADTTEADYFRLISDKTASLISACCELGALTVNATEAQRQALKEYGEQLGLAFQIKDDLLDYEATSGILGKPAMADLQDKKLTLPVLCAFRTAEASEKKRIVKMIKSGAGKKDLKYILEFVNRHNGLEIARQISYDIKDKAIAALSELPDSPAKQALEDLAEFVVKRTN